MSNFFKKDSSLRDAFNIVASTVAIGAVGGLVGIGIAAVAGVGLVIGAAVGAVGAVGSTYAYWWKINSK